MSAYLFFRPDRRYSQREEDSDFSGTPMKKTNTERDCCVPGQEPRNEPHTPLKRKMKD